MTPYLQTIQIHLIDIEPIPHYLVFKSPVKSGYWVPNMVTETLTG